MDQLIFRGRRFYFLGVMNLHIRRSYDLGDIPLGRIRYHIALLGQLLH
mgnify:CR=1 FL=1